MKISVNGIRRSGNHAIAVWFLYHFNGGIEYFNNHNMSAKRSHGELYLHKNNILLSLQSLRSNTNFSDNDTVSVDNFIYGLENQSLSNIRNLSVEKNMDYNVVILRDPINNLASIMKYASRRSEKNKNFKMKRKKFAVADEESSVSEELDGNGVWNVRSNGSVLVSNEEFINLWKDYAKNAMNYDNNILLIYDKWFSDEQYRRGIEYSMNLPNNDRGLNKVHYTGTGSSFDRMEFQNKAQDMNVLNRWEEFKDNEKFLEIINDSELLELREEIFGPLPFSVG